MKLREEEIKELLKLHAVEVIHSYNIKSADEAYELARSMDKSPCFLLKSFDVRENQAVLQKSITLSDAEAVKSAVETIQNERRQELKEGSNTFAVQDLVVLEPSYNVVSSFYLALFFNRQTGNTRFIASLSPISQKDFYLGERKDICYASADFATGFSPFIGRKLGDCLKLPRESWLAFVQTLEKLYSFFVKYDCKRLELFPLQLLSDGSFYVSHAAMSVDNNALFRHPELVDYYDQETLTGLEFEAKKFGVTCVKAEGDIAVITNGTGLGLLSWDLLRYQGRRVANFINVANASSSEMVERALYLAAQDQNAQVILINIFSALLKCDLIAKGIESACKSHVLRIPIVLFIEGKNAAVAKKLLKELSEKVIISETLDDAIMQACSLVKKN